LFRKSISAKNNKNKKDLKKTKRKEKQRDVVETKSIYEKNAFIALLKP